MSTQISIHRALQLIKKHKSRIENSRKSDLVAIVEGVVQKPLSKVYKNKEELQQTLQSNYDSFYGSINTIEALKEKITEANLNTVIKFQGKDLSIIRLLAMKENIAYRKQRALFLKSSINSNSTQAENFNEKEKSALNSIEDSSQRAAREKSFLDFSEQQVITYTDTISPSQFLEKVTKELEELDYELDTLLSENNLQTMITLDDGMIL